MSDYQWHQDQIAGERAMRELEKERKADEGKAIEAAELRELLSAFIDASVLRGYVITKKQWERACLLCGRWCPPFTDHQLKDDNA